MKFITAILCTVGAAFAAEPFHITHEFTNTNAHSVIGLPMGSHKTIVEKDGNLRWSQWSLKRKPLDSPFGFSDQMDGALDIRTLRIEGERETALSAGPQSLWEGRYPFIVTHWSAGDVALEELAFAAESAAKQGLDVVRLQAVNRSAAAVTLETQLSGKHYNLAGRTGQRALVSRDGYEIVLAEGGPVECSSKDSALTLACRWDVPANSTRTVWLKVPYDLPAAKANSIRQDSGEALLSRARESWQTLWAKGPQIHLPQKELEDFFYSSFAFVLILTEYDAAGDLWILDGPGGYRQFWGRGEYFQARALQLVGRSDLAAQSLEHAFRIQMDDGEWDGPPISGWPSWDNIGGNAAGVWEHYQFTRDRNWLTRAYPHLIAAANWIRYHREETELEEGNVPVGARPTHRAIPWSCRAETKLQLPTSEKPYWTGLLPWSYGDSGIPEGHAYAHNFFALYAVECARKAALELGRKEDAAWLAEESANYRQAILASIERAIKLEQGARPYLPAMPTNPQAAWSQSFVAVYPTGFFRPDDALISGLLERVESSMKQGLPTNMAWLGFGGVWPGNSMNVAETYLRRGDIAKAAALLTATLNHSYTTNVWREETRVDKSLPTACPNSSIGRNLDNQAANGDMPEAWANANLVNMVRDMLLLEMDGALHLMPGIPAEWVAPGDELSIRNAPTTMGGPVSAKLSYPSAGKMILDLEAPATPIDVVAHFPLPAGSTIKTLLIDGRAVVAPAASSVRLEKVHDVVRIEVRF